ncbi:helix-turn-helix domain-containing protein [Nocardia sp. XZ_19_385]|uniref:helix-turn-helix domain-containing protein n=1 Tax=Nocardia sp. XZ_19_385 TaxID=2769488 RepID=UPI00188E060C|nr:helix-turn-helix domain-containing protein [Nocardia sp. XZ_19_385]
MTDTHLDPTHPVLVTITPLLDRVGGRLVPPGDCGPDDVPLVWEGATLAAVRIVGKGHSSEREDSAAAAAATDPTTEGGLARLLDAVATELGSSLTDLKRADKQRAVRLLEERGAFSYRKSAETVAEALGVTRFTVYNYLNRTRS